MQSLIDRKLYNLSCISVSIILFMLDSRDIGLKLLHSRLLPFSSKIGIALDSLRLSKYVPVVNERLLMHTSLIIHDK